MLPPFINLLEKSLTYFIKEMTTNPEAFIEIKNFKKKVKIK